ncbi:hypothetical protein ACG7TL_008057 [Trametes sanguinea]
MELVFGAVSSVTESASPRGSGSANISIASRRAWASLSATTITSKLTWNMDFTEIYNQTASLVHFSPGTHFLLTAVEDRLIIRRSDSFQIARTWLVDTSRSPTSAALANAAAAAAGPSSLRPKTDETAWITHAGWSCDSEYVFGACAKTGVVSVFKLRDETWSARIEAGSEGLVRAEWAPDGRTILCFSEWGEKSLRATWAVMPGAGAHLSTFARLALSPPVETGNRSGFKLSSVDCLQMRSDRKWPDDNHAHPASHGRTGYAFRQDARYFVLAERHKSKDTLGVYDAQEAYRLVRYKLYIVSLAGNVLGTFSPDPDPGFGIRMVSWHPSGKFLAVAGSDDKAGTHTGKSYLEPDSNTGAADADTGRRGSFHPPNDRFPNAHEACQTSPGSTVSWKQRAIRDRALRSRSDAVGVQHHWQSVAAVLLYDFPMPSSDPSASASRSTSTSREPLVPRVRSVLLQTQPVTAARWNPEPARAGRLAVACGSQSVYLWSDEWVTEGGTGEEEDTEVAECVGVPAQKFETRDLRWAPDGKGMILLDQKTFCCAFEVEEEGQDIASAMG